MIGPICVSQKKICISRQRICVNIPCFEIIGNEYGNYGYTWHFLNVELKNGMYEIEYLSGYINAGGAGANFGGNCVWYDCFMEPVSGLDLPPGFSYLPGTNEPYTRSSVAEAENIGKKSTITVTRGGIAVCFKDTNITDNFGSIIYGYKEVSA